MAERENANAERRRCSECGAELSPQTPLALCPKCLLRTALPAQEADEVTKAMITGHESLAAATLRPGEQFGHYRILGALGGGGMGSVFEADDLETGRRVALKVLSQSLDSPDARERFFREGRLAASINHPNSVYIFGTEEVGGTPVIAMELVAGGTLEEHVRTHGPMPPTAAVDAVLQIIAGLEAAQKVGILHRDIKPSNCFRALDGTVKIGDFGLSISTSIRTEPALTTTGAFLGTPAFCSPEQLRGEELNARSDMYSVGATLFYLLTGRTPFAAKNVVALIATVLEHPAPSPRQFRPEIPDGLTRIVRRCLDKQASERFRTYDELRQALAPYGSAVPVPGRLALRFAAGLLDLLVLNAVVAPLLLLLSFNPLDYLGSFVTNPARLVAIFGSALAGSLLYYAVLEGVWGATIGKRACRLRVVGPGQSPPGILRALGRALIYLVLPTLPAWAVYGRPQNFAQVTEPLQVLAGLTYYVILGLLFATARRRNGLAAVHDLATGTRVVSALALEVRDALAPTEPPPAGIDKRPRVGPYHILDTVGGTPDESWLLGYDLRLLRKVWLRLVPPGTPPIASALRHLSRIGRLRWLTGVRSPTANWDAFEALDGKPLVTLCAQPQPWGQLRFWLFDLAEEIAAAEKDGTLPQLAPDRVWITQEGRAKLLDFTAPGLSGDQPPPLNQAVTSSAPPVLHDSEAGTRFLHEVAVLGLAGGQPIAGAPVPRRPLLMPLEARKVVQSLPALTGAAAARLALRPFLHRPATVTRARRAAIVVACAALPTLSFVGALFGFRMMQQWNQQNPGLMELSQLLQQRAALRLWGQTGRGPSDEHLGLYIANHYRSVITNESSWNSPLSLIMIKGEPRQFAEKCLLKHSAPTAQQLQEAETAVVPMIPKPNVFELSRQPWFLANFLYTTVVVCVALPALLAALCCRGGLALRVAGVALVRGDGELASRLRVFWRALVAWSPAALALVVAASLPHEASLLATAAPGVAVCALVVLSLALPERGVPDRVAGTWPVLR